MNKAETHEDIDPGFEVCGLPHLQAQNSCKGCGEPYEHADTCLYVGHVRWGDRPQELRPAIERASRAATTQPTWAEVTLESLHRALYIDFEGQKDKPPVLLGSATRSGRESWPPQYITDSAFEPLAIAGGMELLTLPAAIERILLRAEAKDRQIVAWSEHELDVVKTYSPQHVARFESRYVNARSYAVRWRNKCHDRKKPGTNALADYMALIEHTVPPEAGPDEVGKTVARARKSLGKGRGVAGLTPDQLRRWEHLREHNRHDCVGMRKICLIAAEEIDVFEAPAVRRVPDSPGSRRRQTRARDRATRTPATNHVVSRNLSARRAIRVRDGV